MDYKAWVQDLHKRGFKTTGISGNEANFADYGNALSDGIKAKIAKNGQTQADKDLQALVASLFGKKSNMSSSHLISLCKSKGLKVSNSYQKTTYIVDEKSSGKKGQKKVIKGSINIITITDPKTGGKLVIADANGKAAIEIEEVFMNEILSGVTSDIQAGAGAGAGGAGGAGGNDNTLDMQKRAKEDEIERLKKENAEVAKEIEELQTQAKKEIEEAEAEIERVQAELSEEIAEISADWTARYQANPDKYTKEYIDTMIGSQTNSATANANLQISAQEARISNNPHIAQIDKLVKDANTLEIKTVAANTKLQTLGSGGQPKVLNTNGYAMQQTGQKDALPQAQQYNNMMASLKKEHAYAGKSATLARVQAEAGATSQEADAKSITKTISDNQETQEAEVKKKSSEEEQAA